VQIKCKMQNQFRTGTPCDVNRVKFYLSTIIEKSDMLCIKS